MTLKQDVKNGRAARRRARRPLIGTGSWAPPPLSRPAYVALAGLILAAVTGAFLAYGRPLAGPDGFTLVGRSTGPGGSRALVDAYTLLHVVFGMLLKGLLWATSRHWPAGWLVLVALGSGAVWETVENAPPVVERFAMNPVSRDYEGDSLVNGLGDLAAVVAGYGAASLLPVPAAVTVALVLEVGVTVAGLDGIVTAGWKLVSPPDAA